VTRTDRLGCSRRHRNHLIQQRLRMLWFLAPRQLTRWTSRTHVYVEFWGSWSSILRSWDNSRGKPGVGHSPSFVLHLPHLTATSRLRSGARLSLVIPPILCFPRPDASRHVPAPACRRNRPARDSAVETGVSNEPGPASSARRFRDGPRSSLSVENSLTCVRRVGRVAFAETANPNMPTGSGRVGRSNRHTSRLASQ
jgi:hypothetical protein